MNLFRKFKKDAGVTQIQATATVQGSKVAQDVSVLGTSAFGDLVIVNPEPVVRGNAEYDLLSANYRQFSAGTGAVTGGVLLASFTVAKGQSIEVNLKEIEIRVPPTLRFVISGRMASGSASDLTAALTWLEDI